MNLTEAHDYMDMLLDKAEQPYFTTIEKDRYLDLAISEFVNSNYRKMGADEDSRRAIASCIDWNKYELTADDIAGGYYIYNSAYPGLSEKYTNAGVIDQAGAVVSNSAFSTAGLAHTNHGFFKYGNQLVLPKNHLFTISVQVDYYNRKEVMDLDTGEMHPGKDADDIVMERVILKSVSFNEYYEKLNTLDPFQSDNTSDKAGTPYGDSFGQIDYQQKNKRIAYWSYVEGRIIISHPTEIIRFYIQSVILPTVEQAFTSSTMGGNSPSLYGFTFADHYQKKIIQLAVRKAAGVTETGDYQIKDIETQK
tara:strand:+ start:470 stop:1390 length:921 start_codon:yes stop_codon:yes gene_type:complete